MKSFVAVPVAALAALGMLAVPRTAHAQWVKGMVRIENWPTGENHLELEGDSTCAPNSDTGDPLVLKAESTRLDDEGFAWVNNLSYQAVQKFNWTFAIQGPPSPTFYTDVSAAVSGEAGPWEGSVPKSAPAEQQIGPAYASAAVGGVSGYAYNQREDNSKLSFGGSNYQRTTQVKVHYQTEPTADIYHASLAINMGASTSLAPVASAPDTPPGGPSEGSRRILPFFIWAKSSFFCDPYLDDIGKACHAKSEGSLSFGNPYQ